MTVPVFTDTNVLVYARDAGQPVKQQQAMSWLAYLWHSKRGRVSVQVLNEFYYTVTRKVGRPLSGETARREARRFLAWAPLPIDGQLVEKAWELEARRGFNFWDALIVAAAQMSGCRRLLTEDLQDGQNIDGVQVVSPFTTTPDQIV